MDCSLCKCPITEGSRALVLTPSVAYHAGCWRMLMDVPQPAGPIGRRAQQRLGRCTLRASA